MPSCVLLSVRSAETLEGMLVEAGLSPVFRADSAEDARALLAAHSPALLLCDGTGEGVISLCADTAQSTSCAVVLLSRDFVERASATGVLVLIKPVRRERLKFALEFSLATHARCACLRRENQLLQHKMEEFRLVERAKRTLERVLSMPEKQAHRFIEKQAMDARQTRMEIALRILKTYEDTQVQQNK